MEPRFSDFGSSKIDGTSTNEDLLYHSPGYAPAEFSNSKDAKSDGIMLFELITGNEPLGDD
jgi:hypothetical protein